MGNISSLTSRYIIRKTKRFNVENRAQKFIEQDKLPVAPKHPSTSKILESLTKDPKVREELLRKNTELDQNLKQVYVKSLHKPYTNEDERDKLRKTKLPQEKGNVPDWKYGHTEPIIVPKGKFSLAQVIDMLSDHITDPMVNTPNVLADKYSLDVKLVESLILYFRLFNVERTDTKDTQKLLTNQRVAAFTQLEDYMSKQTMYKIAQKYDKDDKEHEELLEKFKHLREAETGIKEPSITKPETGPSKVVEEKKKRFKNKNIEAEKEQDPGIDIDSVYKNVANRTRKKKETTQ